MSQVLAKNLFAILDLDLADPSAHVAGITVDLCPPLGKVSLGLA